MILTATNLSLTVRDKTLLDNITVAIEAGTFTSIIGPNGAGKTTLLSILTGDRQPHIGNVELDDIPLQSVDILELAQRRAVLPQIASVPFVMSVTDIVSLGRAPYRDTPTQRYDGQVINDCLAATDITHLASHNYSRLSGGEQHRVQISRTLAQISATPDTSLHGQILFLDEPTNHLDVLHQYSLMKQLKVLQKRGLTVIAIMHDLSLTLQFAEHIILLNNGKKMGSYTPHELVNSGDLSQAYAMNMQIRWDDEWQRYIIAPSAFT